MKPVILGAGLAGLSTALALAPMPVLLVSPCELGEGCSSAWAQGGIAAAMGADDETRLHAQDTLAAGNDLNDAAIVNQTTQDAPLVIERLIAAGVAFDHDARGLLDLHLEAAHRKHRIVHAKDATGLIVMQALIAAARATPSIEIIENATAQQLLVDEALTGVVLDRGGELITLPTDCVVLATGGATALWRDTTNPHQNWGSGLALAARAGAALGDLEFVQFHPTAIDIGQDPMPLASEALRGEGAVLIDETGARFTDELQPRDIVARAIWDQMTQGHRIFLDARLALGANFAAQFPTIYGLCATGGIDPATMPIPVRPAAHYHMGGVLTDARGRTDIAGLWACGEVACTGLHGANRLASNSLLEAASFGWRVAEDIKGLQKQETKKWDARLRGHDGLFEKTISELSSCPRRRASHLVQYDETDRIIRATMSKHVGVIRNHEGLKTAIASLTRLGGSSDMALVGLMITQCALRREESRGSHYRSDFPETLPTGQRSRIRLSDMKG